MHKTASKTAKEKVAAMELNWVLRITS